jgi:3-hydroxybutyryl-CoA dehydrogenase
MTVGIIGTGAMGSGIAQVAATAGCDVLLYDARPDALDNAVLHIRQSLSRLAEKGKITVADANTIAKRLKTTDRLQGLGACELIIEAIVEDLEVKKMIFAELELDVKDNCILATNTSSLSITAIAAACQKPERVVGIHFFNPATLMPLVEIIPALQTADTIVQKAFNIILGWGKTIVIARDTPGFIVNRIARPYYSEALRIYEEGIAHFSVIDAAMTEGGFKMGPFALMDLIGHDVNYAVTESVWRNTYFEPRYKPSVTQKRLVEAGFLGRKSGRGFYEYGKNTDATPPETNSILTQTIFDRILAMLINEAYDALYWQLATAQDIETAMTKGVNYPKGLLEWGQSIGLDTVRATLDNLYKTYREERYRTSPALLQHKMEY